MTENEAIEKINMLNDALNEQRFDAEENSEALQIAIKALEEVQQYRVLGTIEELTAKNEELKRWHTDRIAENIKNSFANTSTLCCHNCDHKDEYIEELEAEVEEYQAIGTPEECRAAMEKQPVFNMDKVVEQLQKISDEAHDLIMVSDSPQYYDGYEDGVDKAIDIVKAGGVDGN